MGNLRQSLRRRMKIDLNAMRTMSLSRHLGYLVLVGGFAGLAAWILVLGAALVFGMDEPTWPSLLLAVPRGSLFAVILGLALRWYWNRSR